MMLWGNRAGCAFHQYRQRAENKKLSVKESRRNTLQVISQTTPACAGT